MIKSNRKEFFMVWLWVPEVEPEFWIWVEIVFDRLQVWLMFEAEMFKALRLPAMLSPETWTMFPPIVESLTSLQSWELTFDTELEKMFLIVDESIWSKLPKSPAGPKSPELEVCSWLIKLCKVFSKFVFIDDTTMQLPEMLVPVIFPMSTSFPTVVPSIVTILPVMLLTTWVLQDWEDWSRILFVISWSMSIILPCTDFFPVSNPTIPPTDAPRATHSPAVTNAIFCDCLESSGEVVFSSHLM